MYLTSVNINVAPSEFMILSLPIPLTSLIPYSLSSTSLAYAEVVTSCKDQICKIGADQILCLLVFLIFQRINRRRRRLSFTFHCLVVIRYAAAARLFFTKNIIQTQIFKLH